jgi:probable phosphoglycerate mutase|tara:strand:- start:2194 stop:2763 length:570 start_codon:yes stop_codon:yes gene_type:complete
MKIIIARHGQTIQNANRIAQGHLPGKLSSLGIEQAKKLALRLKDEKINVIYTSDLARAYDTAKEIAKYHKGIPFFAVEELREHDLGELTGKSCDIFSWNPRPKEIESKASMRKRAVKLLDKVYSNYPKGTILFVGHGGINKALMRGALNKPDDYPIGRIENTSVIILDINEKENKLLLMNCAKHLDQPK